MYVQSFIIIKHLTYNVKQMIQVIGLSQEGYPFMSRLWFFPRGLPELVSVRGVVIGD